METLIIGKNVIFLPETASTNTYAAMLLKNVNLPEGTVVYTISQTQGKGRRGNVWDSAPGMNLTASFILKPGFLNINNNFLLYQIAALACYDTMLLLLKESEFVVKIKWPNDILVNKQKIAGILIENNVANNRINWTVIGIGINLNQEYFDTITNVTSAKILTKKDYAVEEVLKQLYQQLDKYYLALRNNKQDWIISKYRDCLFGLDDTYQFETNKGIIQYKIKGLGNTGLLLLEDEMGNIKEADIDDVKLMF